MENEQAIRLIDSIANSIHNADTKASDSILIRYTLNVLKEKAGLNKYWCIKALETRLENVPSATDSTTEVQSSLQSLRDYITGEDRDDAQGLFTFAELKHAYQNGIVEGADHCYITFDEKDISKIMQEEFPNWYIANYGEPIPK